MLRGRCRRHDQAGHKQAVLVDSEIAARNCCPKLLNLFMYMCRVYVVDEEGKAVGVVTPTDALRLVSA